MKNRHVLWGLCLVLGLWAGAASAAVAYSAAAQELFKRGVEEYRRGEYGRSEAAFRRLGQMAAHQHSSASQLMLGKSLFRLGRYERAVEILRDFEVAYPQSRYAVEVKLLRGDVLYVLKRYFEAAAEYARLLRPIIPVSYRMQAAERLAAITRNGFISESALQRLEGMVGKEVLEESLLFGEARWYGRLGWETPAFWFAENYIERYPAGAFAAQARRMTKPPDEVVDASPDTAAQAGLPRLGLLLPLSGGQRQIGYDLLNGAQLANQEMGRPFELVVRDLGEEFGELPIVESPAGGLIRTARATRTLVAEQGVQAVVGPVFSTDAVAAAVVAEAAGVPLVAPLAQQSGLDQMGEHIFQLNTIPDVQGRMMGEYAAMVLGLETFVVLAPLTDLGAGFEREFSEAVAENGGRIVHRVWYVPNEKKDFNDEFAEIRQVGFQLEPMPAAVDTLAQLDSLAWAVLDTALASDSERIRVFKEVLDARDPVLEAETIEDSTQLFIETIDGVLIVAESFEDVRTIAPQLHFNRIKTQILGNDVWNDPAAIRQLLPAQRKDLAGTVFVTARPPQEAVAERFKTAFRTRYGRFPGYAAYGYDAVRLLAQGWINGEQSREGLRRWMAAVRDWEGASGAIGFGEQRRTNGELSLMKVDLRGGIKSVQEADLPDFSVVKAAPEAAPAEY